MESSKLATVEVKLASGKTVTVRQLATSEFPAAAAAIDDEPRFLEMVTGETDADQFSGPELTEIFEASDRLNLDRLSCWLKRRKDKAERIAPGMYDALLKIAIQRKPESGSAN